MFCVQSIVFSFKLSYLLSKFLSCSDVIGHFFVFQNESFFINTLLGIKLTNLILAICSHGFGILKFCCDALDGLLHFSHQFL